MRGLCEARKATHRPGWRVGRQRLCEAMHSRLGACLPKRVVSVGGKDKEKSRDTASSALREFRGKREVSRVRQEREWATTDEQCADLGFRRRCRYVADRLAASTSFERAKPARSCRSANSSRCASSEPTSSRGISDQYCVRGVNLDACKSTE